MFVVGYDGSEARYREEAAVWLGYYRGHRAQRVGEDTAGLKVSGEYVDKK